MNKIKLLDSTKFASALSWRLALVCVLVATCNTKQCFGADPAATPPATPPATPAATATSSSTPSSTEEEEEEEEEDTPTPSSGSLNSGGANASTNGAAPAVPAKPPSGTSLPNIRRMKRMSFPEGRFSISLPQKPQMEYRDMAVPNTSLVVRSVFYHCNEAAGAFSVGYVIFPDSVHLFAGHVQDSILDSMSNSFANLSSKQGKPATLLWKRPSTTLGCRGRELMVQAGKSDYFARIRMFVSGQFMYVLVTEGSKTWLSDPDVGTFLSSMTLNDAGTFGSAWHKKFDDDRKEFDKKWEQDKRSFDERFARGRDDFKRDSNASQSRWQREHGAD